MVLDRSALEALGDRVDDPRDQDRPGGRPPVRRRRPAAASRCPTRPVTPLDRPLPDEVVAEVGAAGGVRAHPHRARRVPRRAAARLSAVRALRRHRLRQRRRRDRASSTTFIRARAARSSRRYGGNLLHLTLGDKGAYLYTVFGSPVAHEDDAARAAAAALELRDLELDDGRRRHPDRDRLRAAAQRHLRPRAAAGVHLPRRRGQPVGAPDGQGAARRDLRAGAGAAARPATRSSGSQLAPITVKGKAEPIPVFALKGSKRHASRCAVGARAADRRPPGGARAARRASSTRPLDGHGRHRRHRGRGRHRQVAAGRRNSRGSRAQRGVLVAIGECQSYGTNTSYFVWREIWSTLFGLDDSRSEEEQVLDVKVALAAIDPGLAAREPLLQGAARPADPRQRPHRDVRRQAAQDLARGPARRLPAGAGARRAAGDRAGGLPPDRPAVARPARGAGPRDRRPARADRARVPAGRRARRRAGHRAAAVFRGDRRSASSTRTTRTC